MKKIIFLLLLAVTATSTASYAQSKQTKEQVAADLEKTKAEFAKRAQMAQSKKRGYSNEINAYVSKDSAQFFVGGADTIFLTKNGMGISYDSVGDVIISDRRMFLLPGQMGLYLKNRQHGRVNDKETIWISFQYGDSIVDVPFNPNGDALNNIFVLAGETVVDQNNQVAYTFLVGKDEFKIIRGQGTALLIQMDVKKDFHQVTDMKIHNYSEPSKSTPTMVLPAAMPVQK